MLRRRSSLVLGGAPVDIWEHADVLSAVSLRLLTDEGPPLFIASANLDHIAHFGSRGRSRDLVDFSDESRAQWLVLVDGVPLVWRSRYLTSGSVQQLAGSDLLEDMVRVARATHARFGVLGGTPATHQALCDVLATQVPDLEVAGCWAPSPEELEDPEACRLLAAAVASAGVDMLVVALGKPRQEKFLADYGPATGARVGLAFGAAINYMAGSAHRAPRGLSRIGLEWLWRLAQEPRRLFHRYIVEDPPCAVDLLRTSRLIGSEVVAEPVLVLAFNEGDGNLPIDLLTQESASVISDDDEGVRQATSTS